eukprot:37176-Rhodomonas_salina.2
MPGTDDVYGATAVNPCECYAMPGSDLPLLSRHPYLPPATRYEETLPYYAISSTKKRTYRATPCQVYRYRATQSLRHVRIATASVPEEHRARVCDYVYLLRISASAVPAYCPGAKAQYCPTVGCYSRGRPPPHSVPS